MKKYIFTAVIIIFLGQLSKGQPNKLYYVYLNPISFAFRNPTVGTEVFLKKSFVNAIYFEGSYMIKDNKVGGFLYRGLENEKSIITPFNSYPINRYPIYAYNGPSFRIATSKYFGSSKIYQHASISAILKSLHYDSLIVNYNNNTKEKRTSIYDKLEYTTHFRTQSERMNSFGVGLEYGLKKVKENTIIDFFFRLNIFYSIRNIKAYNEHYNTFYNGNLLSDVYNKETLNYELRLLQVRPQIGLRIGLTNL